MSQAPNRTVTIERVIRRVRGGSQGFLVQGSDNAFYVAKFCLNPQGTRTLINEWVTTAIAKHLGISIAETTRLQLLAPREELFFSLGSTQIPVQPGIHFGSRVPADINRISVFDFLPRPLLSKVSNLADFFKIVVLDCWLGNRDTRQAIFTTGKGVDGAAIRAYFIDHGWCFGGSSWQITSEVPRAGLYSDPHVYSLLMLLDPQEVISSTIELTAGLDLDVLKQDIPLDWMQNGDEQQFNAALRALDKRRSCLSELVRAKMLSIDNATRATLIPKPSQGQRHYSKQLTLPS
jgi:hypothetical protein